MSDTNDTNDESDKQECFLCCDDSQDTLKPLYSVCRCNTLVHDDCFANMVKHVSSHSTHCAVCKQKYHLEKRCTGIKLHKYSFLTTYYIFFTFLVSPSTIIVNIIYYEKNKLLTNLVLSITSFIVFLLNFAVSI